MAFTSPQPTCRKCIDIRTLFEVSCLHLANYSGPHHSRGESEVNVMTSSQLLEECTKWQSKGTPESFARIVAEAFETLGAYQRDLADNFEVAESTVSRWA